MVSRLAFFAAIFIVTLRTDSVSIQHRPHLLEDADKALKDAEQQLTNLQSLSQPLTSSRKYYRQQSEVTNELPKSNDETASEEAPIIVVGSVKHNAQVIKYEIPQTPSPHPPLYFTNKRHGNKNNVDNNNDTSPVYNVSEDGKLYLTFDSDFKDGYKVIEPPPTQLQEAESPWLKVSTPEEEAQIEEAELEKKIATEEAKRAELMKDPNADQDTTRDLLLISRLGRQSEKLMKQLDALNNIQSGENTPEVIAEAKKLLNYYTDIKKQIANAVMKYASYHDFDGGFSSSPDTLTFPMENPKPPVGQLDVVNTKHTIHSNPDAYTTPLVSGGAETVYTPLENPQKPVIE